MLRFSERCCLGLSICALVTRTARLGVRPLIALTVAFPLASCNVMHANGGPLRGSIGPAMISSEQILLEFPLPAERVSAKLERHRQLSGTDIQVMSDGSRVALLGCVTSPVQRSLAVRLARDTPGVQRVEDHLSLKQQPPRVAHDRPEPPVTDARTLHDVVTMLVLSKSLSIRNLQVNVKHGIVTVSGVVSKISERDRALHMVEETADVGSVIDRLTIQ
jgi:osmotically-inducible protein OsmY